MDRNTFWSLVERTRPPDNDPIRHCEDMTDLLTTLEPEEIASFASHFHQLHQEAYRYDLWSAIYEIDGGCSDDGFIDFRSWLVMQGRDVYDTVQTDPQYLGEITLEDCAMAFELFMYMAGKAYHRRTGSEEMPDLPPPEPPRRTRKGRFIKTEAGLRRRFPMLWRLLRKPPTIEPAWLTWRDGLIVSMARTIETERRWQDLPVLADALVDAGCDDAFLLGHLRAGQRHARTCWVVNYLFGLR
jgi:hypothetical protein